MQGAANEEVELLQTEVARLQFELATTTEQLEAASAAAESERSGQSFFHLLGALLKTATDNSTSRRLLSQPSAAQQAHARLTEKEGHNMEHNLGCRLELGQLGSAMARLWAEHEEDHGQLLAAEAAAVQLQESCIQVDSLRAKQISLADSITLMQSLLEVCICCIFAHNCATPAIPCHVALSAAASYMHHLAACLLQPFIYAPPQRTCAFTHASIGAMICSLRSSPDIERQTRQLEEACIRE